MAKRVIGIDFGTSSTFIKVKRYEGDRPIGGGQLDFKSVIFDSGSGSAALPTVIQTAGDNGGQHNWFGIEAEALRPGGILHRNFKVELESRDSGKRAEARGLTEQLFGFLFHKYQEQRLFLGEADDEEETIVSYPAKWSIETQRFMIETAEKAGFSNVKGIDEATASISAVLVQKQEEMAGLGMLNGRRPFLFMVVDMGAGTTDLAVCRYTPGDSPKNEIIATWPQEENLILFGGSEIDARLGKYFAGVLKENGIPDNMSEAVSKGQIDKIKEWKERVLSGTLNSKETVTYCSFLNAYYNMTGIPVPPFSFGREAFENLLFDYLRQFPQLIWGCMTKTAQRLPGFTPGDIDMIILTGGHSQWYFVREMLSGAMTKYGDVVLPRITGDKNRLFAMPRPQEIVSLGLVYQPLVTQAGMGAPKKAQHENKMPQAEKEFSRKEADWQQRGSGQDGKEKVLHRQIAAYDPDRQGCAVWMDGWVYYIQESSKYCVEICRMRENGVDVEKVYQEKGKFEGCSLYAAQGCLYLVSPARILELQRDTWKAQALVTLKAESGIILDGPVRILDGKIFYIIVEIPKKKTTLQTVAGLLNPMAGLGMDMVKLFKSYKRTLRVLEISSGRGFEIGIGDIRRIGLWADKIVIDYYDNKSRIKSMIRDEKSRRLVYMPAQSFPPKDRMQLHKIGDGIRGFCTVRGCGEEMLYLLQENGLLTPYPAAGDRISLPETGAEQHRTGKLWAEGGALFYLTRENEGTEKEFGQSDYIFCQRLGAGPSICRAGIVRANIHIPEMVTFIGDYMYDFEEGHTSRTRLDDGCKRQRLGE